MSFAYRPTDEQPRVIHADHEVLVVDKPAGLLSVPGRGEDRAVCLIERLRGRWPLPTALAFLMWFVFAPQCLSTVAVTRRETNGWKWPAFMLAYLFGLAYLAAGATFWIATWAGL